MRKILAFVFGFAIISSLLPIGNFQNLSSLLRQAKDNGGVEGLDDALQQSVTSSSPVEQTSQVASQVGTQPDKTSQKSLSERVTGGVNTIRSLIAFCMQIVRVGFQMIFQGLFLSSNTGNVFGTVGNYRTLLANLGRGTIYTIANMIWESIQRFIPNFVKNLG